MGSSCTPEGFGNRGGDAGFSPTCEEVPCDIIMEPHNIPLIYGERLPKRPVCLLHWGPLSGP